MDATPQQWMEYVQAVWHQPIRPSAAVFVHGWGDLHERHLAFVAEVFRKTGARALVLNGTDAYALGAPGYAVWRKRLIEDFGIAPDAILATPPAQQTREEAEGLAALVQEHGWQSVTMTSVPAHLPRAFLTDHEALRRVGAVCVLSPATFLDVDWVEPIVIRTLLLGEEHTTRLGRLVGECARIAEYRTRYVAGESYAIASISEGIAALRALSE